MSVDWRAERDGVGHAFSSVGRNARALCGKPNWERRWDWPIDRRCGECERIVTEDRR